MFSSLQQDVDQNGVNGLSIKILSTKCRILLPHGVNSCSQLKHDIFFSISSLFLRFSQYFTLFAFFQTYF